MNQKDQKTRQYLQAWGTKEVPTGLVTDGSLRPGQYQAFALLGWTEEVPNKWPVVILRLALMRQEKVVGGMLLSMPFSPKTERHVCATVEKFGWDGRVWPYKDHGWPEGSYEEESLLNLLKEIELGATLTFPNDPEDGIPTLPVFVGKRAEVFQTAPFFESPMPKYLMELRGLIKDNTPFKSDWNNPS